MHHNGAIIYSLNMPDKVTALPDGRYEYNPRVVVTIVIVNMDNAW